MKISSFSFIERGDSKSIKTFRRYRKETTREKKELPAMTNLMIKNKTSK
jgi:hypothetical protein